MDTNNKIVGIAIELEKEEFQKLTKKYNNTLAAEYAAKAILVFKANGECEKTVFEGYTQEEKKTAINKIFSETKEYKNEIAGKVNSYFSTDPRYKILVERANSNEGYLTNDELTEIVNTEINVNLEEETKEEKNGSRAKGIATGVAAGILAGAIGVGSGVAIANHLKDKSNEPATTIETQIDTEVEHSLYAFDLSSMEDMDEYINNSEILDAAGVKEQYGIENVTQKDRAITRLNILKEFNKEVTLQDDTKQLGGLTIEQLVAVDAYANSNVYEKEDYIKNFGLYDFSNINSDYQNAVLATSSYLVNGDVDASILADIFLDEDVKANFLKQNDYLVKIQKAETQSERKEIGKEYEKFLNDCSINQDRDEYLDYSEHPGMSFVTGVFATTISLYYNIDLGEEVSDYIILGTVEDEHEVQSKLDSICASANTKIDSAMALIEEVKDAIDTNAINAATNYNIRIDNEKEGREAQLKVEIPMIDEELCSLVSDVLCDQEQINELTNKTLAKDNLLVTEEDQTLIKQDAINFTKNLVNNGGGRYKDAATAKLAEKLVNVGDTASTTKKSQTFTTDAEIKALEETAPELVQQAKEEYNKANGTLDYSTEEAKEKTDEKIAEDVKKAQEEGTNYYMSVVSYYQSNGDASGIPSSLQEAYNKLGASTYNLAKQTGVARYNTNSSSKTTGGDTVIYDQYKNAETSDTAKDAVESVDKTTQSSTSTTTNTVVTPTPEPTVAPSNTSTSTSTTPTVTPTAPTTTGGDVVIFDEFKDAEMYDIDEIDENSLSVQSADEIDSLTEEEFEALVESMAVADENTDEAVKTR